MMRDPGLAVQLQINSDPIFSRPDGLGLNAREIVNMGCSQSEEGFEPFLLIS